MSVCVFACTGQCVWLCRLVSQAYVETKFVNRHVDEHVCHMNKGYYDLLKSRCMYCMCEFNAVVETVSLY